MPDDGEEVKTVGRKRRRPRDGRTLFFPVPEDALRRIREAGGGHAEIAIYAALCLAFFHAPTAYKSAFWARHTELATGTGVYIRKIGAAVAILERAGLVVCRKPEGAELADRQPCKYTLPALIGIAKQVRNRKADLCKNDSPDMSKSGSPDCTVRARANGAVSDQSNAPERGALHEDQKEKPTACAVGGGALMPPACVASASCEEKTGKSIFSNDW
jgi:hypothetical protein